MKKVVMVHGWGGSSESDFWLWLKQELESREFEVIALDMPNTEHPKIAAWVGYLESQLNPDEEVYFIGHSIGCQTILRYLERTNKKATGVLLVAPWMHLDENTIKEEGEEAVATAKEWMETPIDFSKVKENTENIVAIFSDDDPYVPLSDENLFKEELDAKTFVENNKGHFNDSEYPDILDKFLEMIK